MQKLRINDEVKILSGKDKGKTGNILKIKEDKIIVKGINMLTSFQKKTDKSKGGMLKKEGLIHKSNVMLICPHSSKPTRVGIKVLDNGSKVRFSKCSDKEIVDSFTKSK